MTIQELISTYELNFENKLSKFHGDNHHISFKWPSTNYVALTEFLYQWTNPGYISTRLIPRLEDVLNNGVESDFGTGAISIEFTQNICYFQGSEPEHSFEIPTQDFYDIVILWKDFLLTPPLNDTIVEEPKTRKYKNWLGKMRSFFKHKKIVE